MKSLTLAFMILFTALVFVRGPVFAQTEGEEIQTINRTIKEKKDALGDVNSRIEHLEKEVDRLRKRARSLETEVAIIENRTAKIELDIEATNLQLSALMDELLLLDRELNALTRELEKQRSVLKTALKELYAADERSSLFLVFGTDSFSEFFERVRFFERVNNRLHAAIERTAELQATLQNERQGKEEKLASVQELSSDLETQQLQLTFQQSAKAVLATQTRESQAEYQALVDELLAEQSFIQNQIVALQEDIDRRLKESDEEGEGATVFSWPLDQKNNRLTALFHDPDYPFRNLFEHSGLDIAAPVGSEVRAPAPGYVAWTRVGRLYGNYMMVIHEGGMATLYAHLSSFSAATDQFVTRGEVIARTGGCRGCPGAGLSTGAHLHFEVRKNGIPTDPLRYVTRP